MSTIEDLAYEMKPDLKEMQNKGWLNRKIFLSRVIITNGQDQANDISLEEHQRQIVLEMHPLAARLIDNRVAEFSIRKLAQAITRSSEDGNLIAQAMRTWAKINKEVLAGQLQDRTFVSL